MTTRSWGGRQRPVRVLTLVVVLSLALGASTQWHGPAAAQVEGTTYSNPTYGYSLSWDEPMWSVLDDASGDLALESDLVQIFLQSGQFYDGDAVACRDDLVRRLPNDASVESAEPFRDGEGLESDAPERAWSTLSVELAATDDDDARSIIERIECQTLVEGEAVLAITWLAPLDQAEGAIADAESLLEALIAPNFGGDSVEGLGVDRYDDPAYGFTVGWDPDAWSAFVPVDTTLGLDSGVSLIAFDLPTGFDGDASACLTASVETLRESPGVDEIRALERDGEEVSGTDDAGWVHAAFEGDYGSSQRFVEIRCVALPDEGAVLRAVHSGPLPAWDDEAELAAPVFASLMLPGAGRMPGTERTPAATPGLGGAARTTPAATLADPVSFAPDGESWTVTYDGTVFRPLDAGLYQTVDLALAGPELVVTFQTVATTDDPTTILADRVADEVGDVGSDQTLAEPPLGPVEGAVGAVYETSGPGGALVARGFVVVPVNDDAVVVIRVFGTPESYEAGSGELVTLVDGVAVTATADGVRPPR